MPADVVAVIPTFRPPANLVSLVDTVLPMVNALVVADDASPCVADGVLRQIADLPGVHVVRHARNAGVARSLNAGLTLALREGARWLLTVDQDSVVSSGYVETLVRDAEAALLVGINVGVIAPRIVNDRSGRLNYPEVLLHGWPTTHEVFQSGALWSVPDIAGIGGFDEGLAMDAVDAEACLSLREQGRKVVLSSGSQIQHSWGDARLVSILGRTVAITEHSANRRASIIRNRFGLARREYRQDPLHAFRSLRRAAVGTVLAVTVEKDRRSKAMAAARAVARQPPTRRPS